MEYGQLLDAYKALVNQLIGSEVAKDSISPTDVAQANIQLADLLEPILNTINDFAITGGTLPPVDASGQDLDLYIQGGSTLAFWRKRNGVWIMEAEVDLGIQIIDGVLSLQASVSGQVVTVSPGSWAINNIIYNKATQTQMNLTPANLNFDRIDVVVADTTGSISLIDGVASSSPAEPTIPANTVVVSYVYVPSESSGNLPYIADSNTPLAPPSQALPDGIINPGEFTINSSSLAIFSLPFKYRLLNVVHTGTQNNLQLNVPDPTYSRIDVIYGDSNGQYGVQTGIAAPTYETPLVPENTIMLAKILRRSNGTNVISIIGASGYVEQILAIIFGDTFHKNGSNIYLDSAEGTQDTGDIVGRGKLGANFVEKWRIYNAIDEKKFFLRWAGDSNDEYQLLTTNETSPLKLWVSGQYGLNSYVTHAVGGTEYLFRSLSEANTQEPSLSTGGLVDAWLNLGVTGDLLFWDEVTSYSINDFVFSSFSGNTYVYKSLQSSNVNHSPSDGISNAFWEFIGAFIGFFPDDQPYSLNDVVIDGDSNDMFVSNVDDNSYALDEQVPTSNDWRVIGEVGAASKSELVLNEDSLELEFEGQYYLEFNIPDGKDVLSCYYQKTGETIRRYKNMGDLTFDETRGSSPYQFGGFDNNSPQTITIIYL